MARPATFEAQLEASTKRMRAHPRWYRFGAVLFVLLGMVYLLGMAALGLLMSGLLVLGTYVNPMTILFLGLPVASTVYSFWCIIKIMFRTYPHYTPYLRLDENTTLWRIVQEVRRKVRCGPIHAVYLSEEHNASIVQIPRMGMFGGHRNELVIGMSLLETHDDVQMRAILAHELAHISRNHSRIQTWLMTTSRLWDETARRINWSSFGIIGGFMHDRFYRWYIPRLQRRIAAMNQPFELQADRIAAYAVGKNAFAEALVVSGMVSEHMAYGYWDDYFARSATQEKPLPVWTFLRQRIQSISTAEAADLKASALAVKTHAWMTHPSIRDRIDALDARVDACLFPKSTAADIWLDENMHNAASEWFDMHFAERWGFERHVRQSLADEPHFETELALDPHLQQMFHGCKASVDKARALLEANPHQPPLKFFLGIECLYRGRSEGFALLDVSCTDEIRMHDYTDAVAYYFARYGSRSDFEAFRREHAWLYERMNEQASTFRNALSCNVFDVLHTQQKHMFRLSPSVIRDEEALAHLTEIVLRSPLIRKAYVISSHPMNRMYLSQDNPMIHQLVVTYQRGMRGKAGYLARERFMAQVYYQMLRHGWYVVVIVPKQLWHKRGAKIGIYRRWVRTSRDRTQIVGACDAALPQAPTTTA